MELILLRHGLAEDTHVDGDFSRALMEKGREQARRAAKLLKSADRLPAIVLTSPLIRARQTAEEFCETAGMPGAVLQGWLACGMTPETAMTELTAFRDFKSVAIVGHEPDFSELIQWILGSDGGGIEMKKGAIASLKISPPSQYGTLNYLIPPKLAK
ncbi:MAG: histidine phosphatase family protein [Luteolibacter sp.]|uniref:SixA phosphatase family protein n=1 Tax=Luteolibacter sp. TaxID=1962973 RepID=UPI003264463C